MKSRKTNGSFAGKGYYIALILCAAAIGISGYLYYQNGNEQDPQLQNPTQDVVAPNATQDVPAISTKPSEVTPTEGTEKPTQPVKQPLKTGYPVSGKTICDYAMESLSYNETTRDWRVHNGIDIAAEAGTKVCAAADGVVQSVREEETMGYTVVIRHEGGYATVYSSLSKDVAVKEGDRVTLGQAIATVANTALLESALGDHIHFSVTWNDAPMDPAEFLEMN